jgi:hypothetical protein
MPGDASRLITNPAADSGRLVSLRFPGKLCIDREVQIRDRQKPPCTSWYSYAETTP